VADKLANSGMETSERSRPAHLHSLPEGEEDEFANAPNFESVHAGYAGP